ncbi:MAG: hypothetical protein ACYSVY_22305 [Planctomycetota bacterium]|jgi:hypothetical protein
MFTDYVEPYDAARDDALTAERPCADCGDWYEPAALDGDDLCRGCRWVENGRCRECGDEAELSRGYCGECLRLAREDELYHRLA